MKRITVLIISAASALILTACSDANSSPEVEDNVTAATTSYTAASVVQTAATASSAVSVNKHTSEIESVGPPIDTAKLESEYLGKWHCVGVITDGKDKTEQYNGKSEAEFGYGIGHKYNIEIESLEQAHFVNDVRNDSKVMVDITTTEEGLSGSIRTVPGERITIKVFEWKNGDEVVLKLENEKLIIEKKNSILKSALVFEKGDSSEIVDTEKADLIQKAKDLNLISVLCKNCVDSAERDLNNREVIKCSRPPVKIKELRSEDYIENNILENLKMHFYERPPYLDKVTDFNVIAEYYICWEINEKNGKVIFAQAADSLDKTYVGQIPYPEKDVFVEHKIGTQF